MTDDNKSSSLLIASTLAQQDSLTIAALMKVVKFLIMAADPSVLSGALEVEISNAELARIDEEWDIDVSLDSADVDIGRIRLVPKMRENLLTKKSRISVVDASDSELSSYFASTRDPSRLN